MPGSEFRLGRDGRTAHVQAPSALLLAIESSPGARAGAGEAGGADVYVASLAMALARHGIEVDIAVRKADRERPPVEPLWPRQAGVRVLNIPAGPPAGLPKAGFPKLLGEVARELRRMARRTGPYHLISSHAWLSGRVAVDLAARWGVPVVHHPHSLGLARNRVPGMAAVPPARIAAEQRIVAGADLLVASSHSERLDLVQGYGAPPDRVRMVYSGVDHELFQPGDRTLARDRLRRRLGADRLARHLLVYVGRVHPVKGIDLAIDTLAELRRQHLDVELVVVGGEDDPGECGRSDGQEAELRRLRERVEGVRFPGALDRTELPIVYQAADLLVAPSWDEPFGLVALEAQACGTPVVAARVGGLTEVVADGTGLLVAERTVRAWSAAIARLLVEAGPGGRTGGFRLRRLPAMRAAAARNAQGFSWDTTAAKLLAVWAEAIADHEQRQQVAPRR